MTEIKCKNRVIKKRAQALLSSFLFKNISGRIIIELIRFVGIWFNQDPSYNGVSYVYYPQNIIMGQYLAYDKHCKFRFGSYVETNDGYEINDNTEKRTVSGICLGTTRNFQGSYKIFSLKTGRVVTRKHNIRKITMLTWFIQNVEALATRYGWDMDDGDEILFVDRFSKENDFSAALYEGGIERVVQDDKQDVDDDNGKTDEKQEPSSTNPKYKDDPPGIALNPTASRGEISGVLPPEHSV